MKNFPSDFVAFLIFTLLLFFVFSIPTFLKVIVNQTTIECIEKPNVCKDRYQYMKLGEKLEKIK